MQRVAGWCNMLNNTESNSQHPTLGIKCNIQPCWVVQLALTVLGTGTLTINGARLQKWSTKDSPVEYLVVFAVASHVCFFRGDIILCVVTNCISSFHVVIHVRWQIKFPLLPVRIWGFSCDIVTWRLAFLLWMYESLKLSLLMWEFGLKHASPYFILVYFHPVLWCLTEVLQGQESV